MRYSAALAALPVAGTGYLPPDGAQVKLNQNECPLELAAEDRARLLDALGGVVLNRYPDPRSAALAEVIAGVAGVRPEMVLVGNGANELLELLVRSTCDPGDRILTAAPTYHLYARFAAINRAELVQIAWGEGGAVPREELARQSGGRTRLLLLCRPNNPTGHLCPPEDVLAVADHFAGMVVVDEAYYDFCRDTLAPFVGDRRTLVVVRTLSKAYGAAGLRLGYALAPESVARSVRALQTPYGVGVLSQAAAGFLLSHPEIMERQRQAILEYRADLARRLGGIEGLTVFPSAANFRLVRTAFSADVLDGYLQERQIFVRNLHWDDRHLRVSVGTPSAHARLAEALASFPGSLG